MPRARLQIDLERVEALAATGASLESIARVLGVSPATLHARKRESTEFRETVERGRAKAEAAYANALRDLALRKGPDGEYTYDPKTRFQAIKFFLERRPGWRMTDGQAEDGQAAIPTIKVRIEQEQAARAAAVAAAVVEQEALPEGSATPSPESGHG